MHLRSTSKNQLENAQRQTFTMYFFASFPSVAMAIVSRMFSYWMLRAMFFLPLETLRREKFKKKWYVLLDVSSRVGIPVNHHFMTMTCGRHLITHWYWSTSLNNWYISEKHPTLSIFSICWFFFRSQFIYSVESIKHLGRSQLPAGCCKRTLNAESIPFWNHHFN